MPHKSYGWLAIAVGIAFFSPSQHAFSAEALKRLSLEESVQLALANNLSLHAVQERIKEAEAQKNESASLFFPQISTTYSFTRLNAPPYFNFPGLPPTVPPSTMVTGTKENYNWSLELRQPLFAGGAIRAGYEIGLIGEDIARSNVRTVQADIIKEVKVAYFRFLKAARIVNVARQSVTGLRTHRNQALIFYNHGLIPKNDLLTAEVELSNGNQLLLRAKNGVELAKAAMNTLLRRKIDAPVELEDILDYRPIDKTWEDCLETVLDNRPEIKTHILLTKQAETIVKQAKSAYLPTINFLGNYSRYGDEPGLSGSAYKSQENWYATFIANWNIWEGGRSKSRLDASLSKEKQAMDAYLIVQQMIILELKEAYLHLREAEQQIPAAKQAVKQAEENLRITQERYREQVARAADVIDAQTILTRAQTDYQNALGDYHISLAGLERAMGTANAASPLH